MTGAKAALGLSGATPEGRGEGSTVNLIDQTADRLTRTLHEKIESIHEVTRRSQILALNAGIESARAGAAGRGFAIIAEEMRAISLQVDSLSQSLRSELVAQVRDLKDRSRESVQVAAQTRLTDLALNAVELIDRNLYERSCDVRWWATDAAIVNCLESTSAERCEHAADRLGVILNAYTVYLDIWLCDLSGRVIANGRPDRYALSSKKVAAEPWFKSALETANGDAFVSADIAPVPDLGGAAVATYAAAVRQRGETRGRPIGVLGVHFDWTPQAQTIVTGLRLADGEKGKTRAMILDRGGRVIAASDGKGLLSETVRLDTQGREQGSYIAANGDVVGFAHTPGYETYRGMGWYGCVIAAGR